MQVNRRRKFKIEFCLTLFNIDRLSSHWPLHYFLLLSTEYPIRGFYSDTGQNYWLSDFPFQPSPTGKSILTSDL